MIDSFVPLVDVHVVLFSEMSKSVHMYIFSGSAFLSLHINMHFLSLQDGISAFSDGGLILETLDFLAIKFKKNYAISSSHY